MFLDRRKGISAEDKARLDSALCDSLKSIADKADMWLLFYPIKNEPDLLPFAKYLLALGKKVAFPISITDTYDLDFRLITDLSQMKAGAYGIPEPSDNLPIINDFGKAICLVPALAFDRRGFRIGYGKGYYDRFLSKHRTCTVGMTYDCLVTDILPTDKNDIPVDMIITESGVKIPDAKQ